VTQATTSSAKGISELTESVGESGGIVDAIATKRLAASHTPRAKPTEPHRKKNTDKQVIISSRFRIHMKGAVTYGTKYDHCSDLMPTSSVLRSPRSSPVPPPVACPPSFAAPVGRDCLRDGCAPPTLCTSPPLFRARGARRTPLPVHAPFTW
jgi:hypothetical protein